MGPVGQRARLVPTVGHTRACQGTWDHGEFGHSGSPLPNQQGQIQTEMRVESGLNMAWPWSVLWKQEPWWPYCDIGKGKVGGSCDIIMKGLGEELHGGLS